MITQKMNDDVRIIQCHLDNIYTMFSPVKDSAPGDIDLVCEGGHC